MENNVQLGIIGVTMHCDCNIITLFREKYDLKCVEQKFMSGNCCEMLK